ncbi:hypothetical protein ANTPLA_LOCUS2158 [Anthophora plagiata]
MVFTFPHGRTRVTRNNETLILHEELEDAFERSANSTYLDATFRRRKTQSYKQLTSGNGVFNKMAVKTNRRFIECF